MIELRVKVPGPTEFFGSVVTASALAAKVVERVITYNPGAEQQALAIAEMPEVEVAEKPSVEDTGVSTPDRWKLQTHVVNVGGDEVELDQATATLHHFRLFPEASFVYIETGDNSTAIIYVDKGDVEALLAKGFDCIITKRPSPNILKAYLKKGVSHSGADPAQRTSPHLVTNEPDAPAQSEQGLRLVT